jgi:hypothetical protein
VVGIRDGGVKERLRFHAQAGEEVADAVQRKAFGVEPGQRIAFAEPRRTQYSATSSGSTPSPFKELMYELDSRYVSVQRHLMMLMASDAFELPISEQ